MTDTFTIRAVVVGLVVLTFACVVGGIILAIERVPMPDFLIALGGGALGGLTGILSRTSADTPVVTARRADVNVTSTTPTSDTD